MKFIKKYGWYMLSFLLPLTVLVVLFAIKGLFTNYSITLSDMRFQQAPMFKYLHDILHGSATFPYTFSNGLGGTMYASLFYYLANPINLFVYFFNDIDLFLTILIIVKMSLCGFTMFIFLKNKFKTNNVYLLIFSLAYALMGYNINYYCNIMWLDGVMMAPLVLLGIERFVNKDKHVFYIITLFLAIIFNFYTGYMLTVFSCLYFFYLLYSNYEGKHFIKDNRKKIFKSIGVTFLTGLLTAFVLIPIAYQSLSFVRVEEEYNIFNYSFFDIIAGSYIGFSDALYPLNDFGLIIYSGLLWLPLVINYLFNKEVKKREKISIVIIYLLLILPVIIQPLNYLWHMFTYPQRFSYRYSFLAVLFSLIISVKAFQNINISKKVTKLFFIIYLILSSALVYLCFKTPDYYVYLTPWKIILSLIVVSVYCLLLVKNKRKLIIGLLAMDLIFNIGWFVFDSKFFAKTSNQQINNHLSYFEEHCQNSQRCESIYIMSYNDGFYLNTNPITVFNSTTNKKIIDFLSKIRALDNNRNLYAYGTYDLISDMLLGVEYIGETRDIKEYTVVDEKVIDDLPVYTYYNPDALNMGFMVSSKIKTLESDNRGYKYLNDILMSMKDDSTYLIKLDVEKISDTKYVIHKNEQYPYIYIESNEPTINIDNDDLNDSDYYGIYFDKDSKDVELVFKEKPKKLEVYTVNVDKLKKFKETTTELEIEVNDGNYIRGIVKNKEAGTLFTSIINEKGWTVYVDGYKVNHFELLDSFIGVDVDKGIHIIEFKYKTPYLDLGLGVSLTSLIILIAYEMKRRKD